MSVLEQVAAQLGMDPRRLVELLLHHRYDRAAAGHWDYFMTLNTTKQLLKAEQQHSGQATAKATLGRGLAPQPMTPELAARMVEEGAQRHRDRMLLERVARQVIREAARQGRSQWRTCTYCTPRVPCYRHEGG
jgi:hypothetical protein